MGNPFKSHNNSRLISTAVTNIKQGGGPKKAGLAPTAILPSSVNFAYTNRGYPKSAAVMKFTVNPNVKQSRPVFVRPDNYRIPGGNY